MATAVERLAVLIEANTKSYERAMAKLQTDTQRALSKVEGQYRDAGNRVEGFMSRVGRGFAGLATVAAAGKAISMFKNMVDGLSQIADAAERAGVSTDFIQAIGLKVQLAGGSLEDAARAAQKFGSALGDVNVAQSYLGRLFAANGQDITKFKNDANGAFSTFANIVARAKTEQEAMNMVSEMFGEKVGPKMRTTIEEIGRVGLPVFIEEMRKAGHVLDTDFIKKGDDIADRWEMLMNRMTKATQFFVLDAIDYFSRMIRHAKSLMGYDDFDARFGFDVPKGQPTRITIPGGPSTNVPKTVPTSRRDDLERELKRMREQIALMKTETDMIDASTYARERAMVVAKLETAAKEANSAAGMKNTDVTAAQREKIDEMADAYARAAVALEQAKGPLRDFAREGKNVDLQLQDAIVGGLKGFEDALIGIIQGTKNAKEAFRDMANAIIADLLRIMIRTNITGPLAGALSSFFGGPAASSVPLPPIRPSGMELARNGGAQQRVVVNHFEGAGGDKNMVQQRRGPNGETVIDMLTRQVSGAMADGKFDGSLGGRYGAQPIPISR